MTAIITGIGGQDGAYLARYLISLGYLVTGITRSLASFQDFRLKYLGILDQVRLIECKDMDKESLVSILDEIRPHEVYNLAAQSSVGLSFEQPYTTMQFNILSVCPGLKPSWRATGPLNFIRLPAVKCSVILTKINCP